VRKIMSTQSDQDNEHQDASWRLAKESHCVWMMPPDVYGNVIPDKRKQKQKVYLKYTSELTAELRSGKLCESYEQSYVFQ
jgi:hypothetical protein